MKKFCIVLGIIFLAGLSVCVSVFGTSERNLSGQTAIDAAAMPVVESTAHLPEHFTWNTNALNIGGISHQIGAVVTGLAPSHFDLPNLHVNIPSNNAGIAVTAIGNDAFQARRNVVMATIPNVILAIGNNAFTSSDLASVNLSEGLVFIGSMAFLAAELTSVIIPNTVTSMGSWAFSHNWLTEVVLPDNLSVLSNGVFANNNLTQIQIPDSVTVIEQTAFGWANVWSWGKSRSGTNNFTQMPIIPSHITVFTGFNGNPFLNDSFVIPAQFDTIGSGAFNASNITNIEIPNTITTIASGAFMNNQITSLTIPNSVTTIGASAFTNNQITSLTIPNSVTTIGYNAFMNNPLTEMIFEHGIDDISEIHFPTSLERVVLPSTIENLSAMQLATVPAFMMTMTVEDWLRNGAELIGIDGYIYVDLWGNLGRVFEQGIFGDNPNLVVYTAHPNLPDSWSEQFNLGTSEIVVWGYRSMTPIIIGQGEITVADNLPLHDLNMGDMRQLTAMPSTGFEFVRWDITGIDGLTTSTQNTIALTKGVIGETPLTAIAVFEIITYDIVYTLNGGTHTGNPDTFTIEDLNITLQDAERYGFNFLGWYTNPQFYGSPVTQIASIGDVRLYARWSEPLQASITYHNLRDTDTYANPSTFYASDLPITLTDVTRNGWTFHGWYRDVGFTQPITQITSFGDIALYARLTINEFTVTFENLQGATPNNETIFTIESASYNLNSPGTRNGWTFGGWWTGANGTGTQWTSVPVGEIGSQTLYAHWILDEFTIYFNNLFNTSHSNPTTFNVETPTILLSNPSTRANYTFNGWWTEGESGIQITQIEAGTFTNVTLYARWLIDFNDGETGITVEQGPGNEITITIPGDPDIVITINPEQNPIVTITPPNDDIIIEGPGADGEITITIPGEYPDEETIIVIRPGEDPPVVIYPPDIRFTVTFDSLGGTAVNFQRVNQGGQAIEPTSTRTLYRLLGWSYNGEVFDFETPITQAKILYAIWERINIDGGDTGIIVNPGDTEDSNNPGENGDIVITIPGEDGEEDTVIIVRPDPDNDGEYEVIITPPNGDITIENDGGGEIIITIPGDNNDEETIIVIRPDEDPPVVIYPPAVRFTVVFDSLGGTTVSSQRVIKGEQAVRPASARTLYRLLGWSIQDNGNNRELFDFDTPITQAKTLYAIWERIDIDTGDTGIIVKPGDTEDNDNPGQDNDIVITIPGENGEEDTIIIVRPDPDNDGEYKVIISPPSDDIVVDGPSDDGTITITIPGDYDDDYTVIIVRPGEDPPVVINPPNTGDNYPNPDLILATPAELRIIADRWLVWSGDERADGFAIYINDEYWATLLRREGRTNQVDLILFGNGTYTFRVRAISETAGSYNSEKSDYITFQVGNSDKIGIPPYPGDVLPEPEPESSNRLPTPTGVSINNNIVTWLGVSNANGFAIYLNGIRLQINGTITSGVNAARTADGIEMYSYNLSEHDLGNGTIIIAVRALGDGVNTNDSFLSLGTILSATQSENNRLNLIWLWILLGALAAMTLALILVLIIRQKQQPKTIATLANEISVSEAAKIMSEHGRRKKEAEKRKEEAEKRKEEAEKRKKESGNSPKKKKQ